MRQLLYPVSWPRLLLLFAGLYTGLLQAQTVLPAPSTAPLFSKADSLLLSGKTDSAAVLFHQLAQDALHRRDTAALQKAWLELGKVNLLREKWDEALNSYLTSLQYARPGITPKTTADAYIGIGVVYSRLRNFAQAEAYLQKALALLQTEDRDRLKALANLAGVYMETGDNTHTLATHQQALQLAAKLQAPLVSAVLYTNLSNYYIKTNNWPAAISSARQSLHLRDSLHKPLSVITCNNLGYALVQSGKVQEGLQWYQQALPLATLAEKKQLLLNLSNGNTSAGNYQQAIAYFKQYDAVKDTIAQKQYEQRVAEIAAKYETADKQQRIARLEAENKTRKRQLQQWLTGSLIVLALLAGILYLRFKNMKVQQQLEQSKTRRQLLQVQLNPHFIFNALHHIQQYIYRNDAKNSMTYLNSFSRLIRLILEHSDVETTSLEEEIEMLEHYLTLQQSGNPSLSFTINTAPELPTADIHLPVMLLQPFVENAVIHGVKNKAQGHVTLTFTTTGQHLQVVITDNGKGIHAAAGNTANTLHRSMGRSIVNQRIAEFNKANKQAIQLKIENATTDVDYPGTAVHLFIPLTITAPE